MVQLDPTYSSPKEGTLGPYNLKYLTNSSPRHRPKCFFPIQPSHVLAICIPIYQPFQ